MKDSLVFDPELIRRYDRSGPRYTSYPTAAEFHAGFGEADYLACIDASNALDPPRPLSLYVHIPFCRTLCFYCACNKVHARHPVQAEPYLEQLLAEIARQGERLAPSAGHRRVEQLHWGGGTPTFLDRDQCARLMGALRSAFPVADDDRAEHGIEIDPRTTSPEDVAWLRRLGFNRISIGVQDFDPMVQAAVNRIQPREVTLEALAAARESGFHSVSMDLIYGLPLQSAERFEYTLDEVVAARPDRLSLFSYAHLPARFMPQRRIRAEDLPSPEEKLRILGLAIERLTAAGYVYIGMDHFALPGDELARALADGTLQRNFQGYSTHGGCDLIGLGASAISSVGDGYAQNESEPERYSMRVAGGAIPVARGVALGADDRLRRDVIMDIICRGVLDPASIERRHGIDFAAYFGPELEGLRPLEADGLVAWEDGLLRVLPRGRLLVRHVCMTFDRYRRETPAEAARFSRVI